MKRFLSAVILVIWPSAGSAELGLCNGQEYFRPHNHHTINLSAFNADNRMGQIGIRLSKGWILPLSTTGCYDLSGMRKRIGTPVRFFLNSKKDRTRPSYFSASVVRSSGVLLDKEKPGTVQIKFVRNSFAKLGQKVIKWAHIAGLEGVDWPLSFSKGESLEGYQKAERFFFEAPYLNPNLVYDATPDEMITTSPDQRPIIDWLGVIAEKLSGARKARIILEDAAENYKSIIDTPNFKRDPDKNIDATYYLISYISDPNPSYDKPIFTPGRSQVCMYLNYRLNGSRDMPNTVRKNIGNSSTFVLKFFKNAKC